MSTKSTSGTVIRRETYGSPSFFAEYQPNGTTRKTERVVVCTNSYRPQPGDSITVVTDETDTVYSVTVNGTLVHRRPSTLSLIRALIVANKTRDEAMHACDNHYQAGYDTGYRAQYLQESSQLHDTYSAACGEIDRIECAIYARFDMFDYHRALHIARKYA